MTSQILGFTKYRRPDRKRIKVGSRLSPSVNLVNFDSFFLYSTYFLAILWYWVLVSVDLFLWHILITFFSEREEAEARARELELQRAKEEREKREREELEAKRIEEEQARAVIEQVFSVTSLTHFMPFSFYTPWKYQKTRAFLMLLRGIERDRWLEMG